MKRAVFLDKDGTLIKNVRYNVNPDLVEFAAYTFEAMQLLQKFSFLLVIITNQPGIAFGYFSEKDLEKLHQYISNELKQRGIQLSGFYYCPHHTSGNLQEYSITCDCRKPAPGLLFEAASDMQIDITHSWMIGDILNDIEAGNKAGCKTILINNGNETEWLLNDERQPSYIAMDLLEAAKIITNTKSG